MMSTVITMSTGTVGLWFSSWLQSTAYNKVDRKAYLRYSFVLTSKTL